MPDLDILSMDQEIRETFQKEFKRLPYHQCKLKELEYTLAGSNINERIRALLIRARDELSVYVQELEEQNQYNFYLVESLELIERYKLILKVPIKVTFMGKPVKENKAKRRLVKQYLEVASQYVDVEMKKQTTNITVTCTNCPNKKEFDVVDRNTYICTQCYAQQIIMKHNSSYHDIDRVNISAKYMYDRKVHFRDCIKQYQGKQNSTIQSQVYQDLEEQFRRHHLLQGIKDAPRNIRFAALTKNHILLFLKELGYANHYENVHLIHQTFYWD